MPLPRSAPSSLCPAERQQARLLGSGALAGWLRQRLAQPGCFLTNACRARYTTTLTANLTVELVHHGELMKSHSLVFSPAEMVPAKATLSGGRLNGKLTAAYAGAFTACSEMVRQAGAWRPAAMRPSASK